jgi:hypothetical protein
MNGSMQVAGEFASLAAARRRRSQRRHLTSLPTRSFLTKKGSTTADAARSAGARLLAGGCPAIAERLQISDQTVKLRVVDLGQAQREDRTTPCVPFQVDHVMKFRFPVFPSAARP